MIEPQTLRFLSQLKKNNNKNWFDAHRAAYEAARIDFSNFIQLVIDDLQKTDTTLTGLSARECLFRINRDVRFAKDKSPYKTNFGASIKRGGKKSPFAGYYFHLEPGQSFAGGGIWMPDKNSLKKLRQEIDYNFEAFKTIVSSKPFKKYFGEVYKDESLSLSTAPKGYEKNHPAMDYLRLKSLIAERPLPDEALTKSSLHKTTVGAFLALKPLIDFINTALETAE